jgi:hypothetical protein
MLERLADTMADALRAQSGNGAAPIGATPRATTDGGEIDVAVRTAAGGAPRP